MRISKNDNFGEELKKTQENSKKFKQKLKMRSFIASCRFCVLIDGKRKARECQANSQAKMRGVHCGSVCIVAIFEYYCAFTYPEIRSSTKIVDRE